MLRISADVLTFGTMEGMALPACDDCVERAEWAGLTFVGHEPTLLDDECEWCGRPFDGADASMFLDLDVEEQ